MQRTPVTKCPGLVTQFNPLNIEPGSLSTANNVRFPREDVCEKRAGYREAGAVTSIPTQSMVYRKKHIVHHGVRVGYESGTDTYSDYSGSYSAPSQFLMQGVEANQNLYVTTSIGVQVFQNITGTAARLAGAPRALDLGPTGSATGTMVNADATGFLSDSKQTAYRVVIYRTDLNNNLLIGYPSQRLWVTNTTGNIASTTLRNYLPADAAVGDVGRVFRATQVSGVSSDTAGDDLGLVYSYTLTSTDISNGYFDFTDRVIDDLIGETIYTSPGFGGIANANDRPPLTKALAFYKNAFMFAGNTETAQRLFIALVGTSGLTGNTITIAGTTYNFGATEIQSGGGSPRAAVSTGGTQAYNIDATARSLVRVINRYSGNTSVYAYYTSGPDDLPGKILIQSRTVGSAAFTVTASNSTIGGMFDPPPPTSVPSVGPSVSSNDDFGNRLHFSKYQEPEHFPLAQYLPVGSANFEILAAVPLRDSLIIIKEEGVFRLIGDTATNFVVTTLDDTVFCRARNSIAKVANQVIMLSNQGFVGISDTGVEVISRNIEPDIRSLLKLTNIDTYTRAYTSESDREYRVSLPSVAADTEATQAYVYNIFTRNWSKSDVPFTSGVVENSRDKVFFTKTDMSMVYQERRAGTDDDFWDPEVDIVITSVNTSTGVVEFTVTNYDPKAGDYISQGGTQLHIDTVAQNSATLVWSAVMDDQIPSTWAAGAAEILPAIVSEVIYNPWHAGAPADMKQLIEWTLLTDNNEENNTTSENILTFRTDLDQNVDEVPVSNRNIGWGAAWGDLPWGGISNPQKYRTWVPKNKAYATFWTNGFVHRRSGERISVLGSVYHWDDYMSEATNK